MAWDLPPLHLFFVIYPQSWKTFSRAMRGPRLVGCLDTVSWLLEIFCPEVATGLCPSLSTWSKALCQRFQHLTLYIRPAADSMFSHHPQPACWGLGLIFFILGLGTWLPASLTNHFSLFSLFAMSWFLILPVTFASWQQL